MRMALPSEKIPSVPLPGWPHQDGNGTNGSLADCAAAGGGRRTTAIAKAKAKRALRWVMERSPKEHAIPRARSAASPR
jgi:hypothetical protein